MKKSKLQGGVTERFSPSPEQGLTDAQAAERTEHGLVNRTDDHTEKTYGQIVFENVFSLFSCILYGVAIVYIVVLLFQNSMIAAYPDIVSIDKINAFDNGGTYAMGITKLGFLTALISNIVIGIFQECRAKKAVEKLQLVTKQKCRVVRSGRILEIFFDSIVLDDVIIFRTGSMITVDGPVIKGFCTMNESMLTGESKSIDKNIGSIVHSGTVVSSGEIWVRADRIGEETSASEIKHKITEIKRKKSRLLRDLNKIIKILAIVLIPITLMTFMRQFSDCYANLVSSDPLQQTVAVDMISQKVGAAIVGAIPTGLLLLSSVSLATSTFKLSKRHTIVRDLYAVESLSRVDTVCFDKTGTITTGDLQVEHLINISDGMRDDELSDLIGSYVHSLPVENVTASALATKFTGCGSWKTISFKPFCSETKRTSVTMQFGTDTETYEMGAPDFLFGTVDSVMRKTDFYTSQGLRVIAFGRRTSDGLSPLALIVISDCIRDSVYGVIKYFKDNDIAVKIISGDSLKTVSAIATKIGVPNADKCISLEGVPDDQIEKLSNEYAVFCRVSPNQKRLLVDGIQKNKHYVALTGDGTNDIIAMQTALTSVSFASATDAAKSIADIVFVDNDFSHMKDVISEGRRQLNNITRVASLYLMKSFFTLAYQLLVLPLNADYFYISHQLYFIVEGIIAGFGGLCLTFEGNYNKYDGDFLENVLTKSIPAAFFLIVAVGTVDILSAIPGFEEAQTGCSPIWLATALFTVAGYAIFFKQCAPFTLFRGVVFAVCLISGVGCMFFMPQVFLQGDSPQLGTIHDFMAFYMQGFDLSKNIMFNGTVNYMDYAAIASFAALGIPVYYGIYNIIRLIMHKLHSSFAA